MTARTISLAALAVMVLALVACPSAPKYPACDQDKDCKNGEHCVNKKCVQCASNDQCGPGQQCSAGACNKIPGFCNSDGDCPEGQTCENHACVAKHGTKCAKDEDCAEDEDCVNGYCQKGTGRKTTGDAPKCQSQPVYFGFDQYVLDDASKAILQKDFECLQSEGARKVNVVGYTDPRGTAEYNVALSDDRAQAVITYLGRLGVEPARMSKVPKGSSEAKGSNDEGWKQDRRVEITWQ